MVNPRDLFDKAKQTAQQHSEQIRGAIDKAEDFVDERTGGKHADKVDKAGDFIEDKLGIRRPDGPAGEPPATDGRVGEPPATTDPRPGEPRG